MSETDSQTTVRLKHRPKNTRFHQQRLKAWRPVLTAKGVYPIFLAIGFVFLPVGIVLFIESGKVDEVVLDYTHCKREPAGAVATRCSEEVRQPEFFKAYSTCPCRLTFTLEKPMVGQVYFYYGLSNFFQNHRRYVMSRDDRQLNGQILPLNPLCEPYRYNSAGLRYAPCGAIAMSLFNDTFTLTYAGGQSGQVLVPMTNKGIAWKSDVQRKFGKPAAPSWADTVKPDSWPRTALNRSPDAYSGDEDLLVWMRNAALPTFRKLYRIVLPEGIFVNGLPAGQYFIDVGYAYPVTQFGGTKRVIISTTSWLGGRNPTLGIAYMTVGSLNIVLGFLFLALYLLLPRRING